MKKIFVSLVFLFFHLVSYAQTGSITGIQVTPRSDGSGLFDIYFTLSGSEGAYNINLEVSFDGGSTYNSVSGNFLSGHISNVSPGSNRLIVWDGMGSFPNQYSTQTKIKIVASDYLPGALCYCEDASFCDFFLGPSIETSWNALSGTWNIQTEGLYGYWSHTAAQTDQGILMLNHTQYDPNNFIATTRVKVRTGYQISGERFVLRSSPGNQILIAFNWNTKSIDPHVRRNSSIYSSISTVSDFEHFNNNIGEENEYSIKKTNSHVAIYVNGFLATEFEDIYFYGNTFLGLATYGTSYYRDFRVCSPHKR